MKIIFNVLSFCCLMLLAAACSGKGGKDKKDTVPAESPASANGKDSVSPEIYFKEDRSGVLATTDRDFKMPDKK